MLGTVFKDLPLYLPALARGGKAYLAIRNRAERLEPAPDASGFRCDWQWTSDLHAPKVIPALGRRLMRCALAEHPILRVEMAAAAPVTDPQVSFLIGHRGMARLPHLLATLETIAAQKDVEVECIIVEQETDSQLGPHLPPWARLVHTPPPTPHMPYCRSWAFNVAARHARAPVLVLHDNDMLVPGDYAAQALGRIREGFEILNLKRFVFYLTPGHTQAIFERTAGLTDAPPLAIVQNLEGGGSIAITRSAFNAIGGFDETFVGWGGEDVEFWERASSLRVWPYASLPLVHLWHKAQPGKASRESDTLRLYHSLARTPVDQRIARLRRTASGALSGPQLGDAHL